MAQCNDIRQIQGGDLMFDCDGREGSSHVQSGSVGIEVDAERAQIALGPLSGSRPPTPKSEGYPSCDIPLHPPTIRQKRLAERIVCANSCLPGYL